VWVNDVPEVFVALQDASPIVTGLTRAWRAAGRYDASPVNAPSTRSTPPSTTTTRGLSPMADAAQFVRLLTLHERRVYAFILSLIPNWADADEVQQETNVRLWNEFDKFTPGTDFGAWACAVARYQVMTFRKKRGREKVQFTDEFLDVVARESAADDDAATRHQALACCVDELNPNHREILRAFYEPGAVGAEVATRFNRSLDALYKALSRIRKLLHDCVTRKLKAQVGA
jgi:RNA polymerase sigma-70 factor (ECF subfamily)